MYKGKKADHDKSTQPEMLPYLTRIRKAAVLNTSKISNPAQSQKQQQRQRLIRAVDSLLQWLASKEKKEVIQMQAIEFISKTPGVPLALGDVFEQICFEQICKLFLPYCALGSAQRFLKDMLKAIYSKSISSFASIKNSLDRDSRIFGFLCCD